MEKMLFVWSYKHMQCFFVDGKRTGMARTRLGPTEFSVVAARLERIDE